MIITLNIYDFIICFNGCVTIYDDNDDDDDSVAATRNKNEVPLLNQTGRTAALDVSTIMIHFIFPSIWLNGTGSSRGPCQASPTTPPQLKEISKNSYKFMFMPL